MSDERMEELREEEKENAFFEKTEEEKANNPFGYDDMNSYRLHSYRW